VLTKVFFQVKVKSALRRGKLMNRYLSLILQAEKCLEAAHRATNEDIAKIWGYHASALVARAEALKLSEVTR